MAYLPRPTIIPGSPELSVWANSIQRDLATREVNADGFSIVGDGITDDRAHLQAACDYAATIGGGTVKVPSGNFLLSAPLVLDHHQGVRVEGQPFATRFLRNGAAKTIAQISSNRVELVSLTFAGGAVAASSGAAVQLVSGSGARIENCYFIEGLWIGLESVDGYNAVINRCVFTDHLRNGIHWQAVAVPDRTDSWIDKCLFSGGAAVEAGVRWDGGSGLRIIEPKILGHDVGLLYYAAPASTGQDLKVNGGSIENCTSYGIRAMRQSGTPQMAFMQVHGVQLDNMPIGIDVNVGFPQAQIANNIVRASFIGINVGAGDSVVDVSHNQLISCPTGIKINDATKVSAHGNSFESCTVTIRDETGIDSDYGIVEHKYHTHASTSDGTNYTTAFEVYPNQYKTFDLTLRVSCLANGVGKSGGVYRRLLSIDGLGAVPVIATIGTDVTVGAAGVLPDISFDVGTNDVLKIKYRKPSSGSVTSWIGRLELDCERGPLQVKVF